MNIVWCAVSSEPSLLACPSHLRDRENTFLGISSHAQLCNNLCEALHFSEPHVLLCPPCRSGRAPQRRNQALTSEKVK